MLCFLFLFLWVLAKIWITPVLESCFVLCCRKFYNQSCIKIKKIKLQMCLAKAGAGLAPWREGTSRWGGNVCNVSRVSRCKHEYIQRVKQCSHPGVLVIGVNSHSAPSRLPAVSPYGPDYASMERLEKGRRGEEKSPCQRRCSTWALDHMVRRWLDWVLMGLT